MTLNNRFIPSLLSSLALLSFKRKKDNEGEGAGPTSLDDVQTNDGELSLGSLGGGLGGLSMLGDDDTGDDGLGDALLAGSGSGLGDRKVQELEVGMNDLEKQVEAIEQIGRVTRGELDTIKEEMSEVKESIRNLLNVYEAIYQPYNPFVDNDGLSTGPMMGGVTSTGNRPPIEDAFSDMGMPNMGSGESDATLFDDDGPLDRIVRPDEEEYVMSMESPLGLQGHPMNGSTPPRVDNMLHDAMERSSPSGPSSFDPFVLEQFYKLVGHQLEKAYRTCLGEGSMRQDELDDLDRWLAEFKGAGGA